MQKDSLHVFMRPIEMPIQLDQTRESRFNPSLLDQRQFNPLMLLARRKKIRLPWTVQADRMIFSHKFFTLARNYE